MLPICPDETFVLLFSQSYTSNSLIEVASGGSVPRGRLGRRARVYVFWELPTRDPTNLDWAGLLPSPSPLIVAWTSLP